MEYPKLNLGGITTYLRAVGHTWVSLPLFTLPLVVEILGVTSSTWRYALCEKEFLDSNRNTDRIPQNQLRRVSQRHLVQHLYAATPPLSEDLGVTIHSWCCRNTWPGTRIHEGRPDDNFREPSLPHLAIWNTWHLALFEYLGSNRYT